MLWQCICINGASIWRNKSPPYLRGVWGNVYVWPQGRSVDWRKRCQWNMTKEFFCGCGYRPSYRPIERSLLLVRANQIQLISILALCPYVVIISSSRQQQNSIIYVPCIWYKSKVCIIHQLSCSKGALWAYIIESLLVQYWANLHNPPLCKQSHNRSLKDIKVVL